MTPLVIGLGNPDRGDDGIGVTVARQVAADDPAQRVRLLPDPSALLDAWDDEDAVVVVDAMVADGEPGSVRVIDAAEHPLPAGLWAAGGTHALGLAAAVELGRTLGRLPRRLVVVGIQAVRFDHGAPLSPPVADAVLPATRAVQAALAAEATGGDP